MRMIDEELTRDQFAELDAETIGMLVAAVESNFATWAGRLADAAEAGDGEGAHRARHALSLALRGLQLDARAFLGGWRRGWSFVSACLWAAAMRPALRRRWSF